MRHLLVLVAAALVPAALHAQAPEYRRPPGDTLRYREVTRAVTEIISPQRTVTQRIDHDARIALAFAAGDTARAWYEALALRVTPFHGGKRVPRTAELLGVPFVLTLGARGDVATLKFPPFPRGLAETWNLIRQFDDFFVKLPAAPLRPGAEWTDTTRVETPHADLGTVRTLSIRSYRVRGDTTVGGTRAVVIGASVQNRLQSSGPGPEPGVTLNTLLEGTETGTIVFAPAAGRMLRRTRTGTLAGHIDFVGGSAPLRLSQKTTTESTIELVP